MFSICSFPEICTLVPSQTQWLPNATTHSVLCHLVLSAWMLPLPTSIWVSSHLLQKVPRVGTTPSSDFPWHLTSVVRGTESGASLSGLSLTSVTYWLHYLGLSCSSVLGLRFLICKMGTMIVPSLLGDLNGLQHERAFTQCQHSHGTST